MNILDLPSSEGNNAQQARPQMPQSQPTRIIDQSAVQVGRGLYKFLDTFLTNIDGQQKYFYREQLEQMQAQDSTTLYVDFTELSNHHEILAEFIQNEYIRFEPYLRQAVRDFVKTHKESYLMVPDTTSIKEFWIAFYNMGLDYGIRDIRSAQIGQLIAVRGTVTRTSVVRPELLFGTFQCQLCQAVVKDIVQQFKYTEPTICPNSLCMARFDWSLMLEQSKFVDWQRVRIQENPESIPPGALPRSIDVILRNDAVEKCKAGDKVTITGSVIVVPDVSVLFSSGTVTSAQRDSSRGADGAGGVQGLKATGARDLGYKLTFLASKVESSTGKFNPLLPPVSEDAERTDEEIIASYTEVERQELAEMIHHNRLYEKLVDSMAPTIFGHDEVKRGILLMMLGGVHKTTADKISLRGDINVCIVGDPSTSKSQFLKYVAGFMPRSIYTSGKSSSAAGLTATVVRDEESGEFTIEAGALMLADNGVCCIDEFDKMEVHDQVAIHEAMEQQTISIAKAGIQATLNARTSILAAANPVFGRYDKTKPLKANIQMSPAIMSRFDLFFVVLDDVNSESDMNIAKHIVAVHRLRDAAVTPEWEEDKLRRYVNFVRGIKPQLTKESAALLVTKYKELRAADSTGIAKSAYRITVRQLESLVRLSEAIARAYADPVIKEAYVREAARLLQRSIIHVEQEPIDFDDMEAENVDKDNPIDTNAETEEQLGPKKKKIQISYEKFRSIVDLILMELHKREIAASKMADENADEEAQSRESGMTRDELCAWTLDQLGNAEAFADEEEMMINRKLVYMVIQRMLNNENMLIQTTANGEMPDAQDPDLDPNADGEQPLLQIHPNYQLPNIDE